MEYRILMRSNDGLFCKYLSDVYDNVTEANKWIDYLQSQEQNQDYEFLLVISCTDTDYCVEK